MAGLHALLQEDMRRHHDQLEALPFLRELRAGSLPKPAVVTFLRSLAITHGALERELSQISGHRVAEPAKLAAPKLPLLLADLDTLKASGVPSIVSATRNALEYGAEILADACEPLSLVGTLYALEGAQDCGLTLRRDYARCLGVHEHQLSYCGCYGKDAAARWNSFEASMDALELRAEQMETVLRSANRCHEQLTAICAALYPYADSDLRHHVTATNFEAGDYAMPQDPREIDLALRIGRATWKHYPYLEQRFGERGGRFNSGDSCWLVALVRMPEEAIFKNLGWLRTILASRGIPTIIFEGHLRAIAEALSGEFADQPDMQTPYNRFLSSLSAERRALGVSEAAPRLGDRFERRFRSCSGYRVDAAAQLIISAWTDERSGIVGALAAVRNWFAEPARFSGDWIDCVNELVTALDQADRSPC